MFQGWNGMPITKTQVFFHWHCIHTQTHIKNITAHEGGGQGCPFFYISMLTSPRLGFARMNDE